MLTLLDELNTIIKKYITDENKGHFGVVDYKDPHDLKKIIQFEISQKGVSETTFLDLMNHYLQYSVHTGNKQFLNQLYAGFNLPAFIGEVLTALSNTSMYTYEVAPVATSIEKEMIQLMNRYAGFLQGDGIFVTGGSNGNLLAMLTARNQKIPSIRVNGYQNTFKLTAFVNEQAHYSYETAANIIGIGAHAVFKVKARENGSICTASLSLAIKESKARREIPFFVGATCGTTLLGAYDDLETLADICKEENLWLHADGSFGGSVIISHQYRYLMKGIEQVDSFVWNPHKLMNIPLICSVFLVKQKGILQQNITDINADYIFHDIDDIEDLGKKSIQCGRRVDAVKLWFAWKYFGLEGYENRLNNIFELASYAAEKVKADPRFELASEIQSFTVCFRCLPTNHLSSNDFNFLVRENLRKSGKSMVNYGYLNKMLTIRLVTANGELTKADIDLFFDNLVQCYP